MPSYKGKHDSAKALAVASQVVALMEGHCWVVEIVGSLRRRRPVVGDVDLIAISYDVEGLRQSIQVIGGTFANVSGWVMIDGVSVDISLVKPENWGAALMHSTGPKEENIRLRAIAARRGLMLSQKGLTVRKTGQRIAGSSEEEVYEALGLEFVPPEWRDVSSRKISAKENEAVLSRMQSAVA